MSTTSLYERLQKKGGQEPKPGPLRTLRVTRQPEQAPDNMAEIKSRIRSRLASDADADLLTLSRALTAPEQDKIRTKIRSLLDDQGLSSFEQDAIERSLVTEILGFGPIQPLLDDPTVSEIMINGIDHVYVERQGCLVRESIRFGSVGEVLALIDKIVTPMGRRIDESSPMVDARLPDGSRVNAIIHPLAVNGAALTIRKFSREPLGINELIRLETVNEEMAGFLQSCVQGRLNILVSGGTGSGKTTTLNVLSSFIPDDERIVTIEDAAELQLRQEHVVSLETRPPNIEGKGEVPIRQLVRNSLRMRPDRIIVGEVRSGETLDMLQAMNTGHDGSLSTVHANGPRDAIARLETMVLMAGMELPVKAIREQIASALDLIIQQTRFKDGRRRITHVTEVVGMEGDVVVLQDLFLFKQGEGGGKFAPTGLRPTFSEALAQQGLELPAGLFENRFGRESRWQ